EERRKTEIVLHLGVIAFALYNFTELAALLGPAPVLAGIVTGLCGFLYSQWLRTRWTDDLRVIAVPARTPDARPRRLQAM
ncbi:MAG TPA: hypothetical protein VFQ76_11495, partial [Longimicrobiaceae bacterium]|nr:hypothetical protein [Longimicrobiaceae bacterium]